MEKITVEQINEIVKDLGVIHKTIFGNNYWYLEELNDDFQWIMKFDEITNVLLICDEIWAVKNLDGEFGIYTGTAHTTIKIQEIPKRILLLRQKYKMSLKSYKTLQQKEKLKHIEQDFCEK